MNRVVLRRATPADAAACAEIYAPYVTDTVITFEEEVPDAAEFARRMEAVCQAHGWIVACAGPETGAPILGYAYYSKFRERRAYRWVVESSIYLRSGVRGKGLGTRMYRAILDLARLQGYRRCYGVVTLPNDASQALHERLGFSPAGIWPQAGFKHGRWLDVGMWDLALGKGSHEREPHEIPAETKVLDACDPDALRAVLDA